MALKITRPEKIVNLCTDAALQAEWEQANEALINAPREVQDDRLNGGNSTATLARAVQDVEQRMLASTVKFRLRGLRRSEWSERVAANAPREGNDDDKARGYNTDTFYDDVISRSIVEVTQDGEPVDFDPLTEWEPLADEMTDRQYAQFAEAVWNLNRGEVSVPFSRSASRALRSSSEN